MSAFRPHMQITVDHTAVIATILAVDGPGVVTDFDQLYFYRDWDRWVQALALKRWLRHIREHEESVFVGRHNVDVFSVPTAQRLLLYMLVSAWCMETIECAGICPMPTTWLYIYYCGWKKYEGMFNRGLTNSLHSGSSSFWVFRCS